MKCLVIVTETTIQFVSTFLLELWSIFGCDSSQKGYRNSIDLFSFQGQWYKIRWKACRCLEHIYYCKNSLGKLASILKICFRRKHYFAAGEHFMLFTPRVSPIPPRPFRATFLCSTKIFVPFVFAFFNFVADTLLSFQECSSSENVYLIPAGCSLKVQSVWCTKKRSVTSKKVSRQALKHGILQLVPTKLLWVVPNFKRHFSCIISTLFCDATHVRPSG